MQANARSVRKKDRKKCKVPVDGHKKTPLVKRRSAVEWVTRDLNPEPTD
jgi:hypothetical protein